MEVIFQNPGAEYMLKSILAFQTEGESSFWSEPLYHFYPQLDKAYAQRLPSSEKKAYLQRTLRAVYAELEETINEKTREYARHWRACKPQVTAALSDAFGIDCGALFNDLRCNVSMNPISPRFLKERCFEVFYLNSERGAIGMSLHEIIHFVWFSVWNRLFADRYDDYERPSLQWIISEMVVESIMRDERLSSINPYFPREQGGCIYPYFFDMMADGAPIVDTLDAMYRSMDISSFMKACDAYCRSHEAQIRAHIQNAER